MEIRTLCSRVLASRLVVHEKKRDQSLKECAMLTNSMFVNLQEQDAHLLSTYWSTSLELNRSVIKLNKLKRAMRLVVQ